MRSSISRSLDTVDAFAWHVLQAVSVLVEPSVATVAAGLGEPPGDLPAATADDVADAVSRLVERALLWGPVDQLRLVAGVQEQLGRYPLGLGAPLAELLEYVGTADLAPVLTVLGILPAPEVDPRRAVAEALSDPRRRGELIAQVGADARDILQRLSVGPPAGLLPPTFSWPPDSSAPPGPAGAVLTADPAGAVLTADPAGAVPTTDSTAGPTTHPTAHPTADPTADPVTELVERGLLVLAGGQTAELPREVGLQVRGERPLGWAAPRAPEALPHRRDVRAIDATGSVAALELVRLVDALCTSWSDEPPAQLRSGGLSVRELRRSAKTLAVDETMTALVVELSVAADLVSAPMAREQPWRPTTDYDTWTERRPEAQWLRLAQAWRTMTRAPYLVGQRDERGKARSALSYEVERSTAPGVRAEVMQILAAAPQGAVGTPATVLDHLAWLLPRREPTLREPAAAALAEAELLGVTGGGGPTSFGRAVLVDDPRQAERMLAAVLPAPVDYFLLQPDLTLVVPGPPSTELGREIATLADLESAGGASVFRISESSVRRAFDNGRSADDIRAVFAARSRTPVPQALDYLVEDLARRHGVLRAGTAGCYLRCEDVSLLDRVVGDRTVAGVRWQRLAPTVAVTATSPQRLLELLRAAGYAPAGEDLTGSAITADAAPARSRPRRPESNRTVLPPELPDSVLADAVRRMRRTDELSRTAHRVNVGPDVPGVTSATTLTVLRQAIRADGQVWVSVADGTGSSTSHILAPLSLAAGYLRGHDVETGDFRTVPLHRITSVNVLS